MYVSQIQEENLTPDILDRLLFRGLEDTGEDADCIIVLGSSNAPQYRVPVAVSAYRAGRAGHILLCGGAFHGGSCCEAELMRQAALDLGVAEEHVIAEADSQNTIENILFALIHLQRVFWLNNVRRVLLVTTAYHMRRSLAIARYLFPPHIEVLPCPANDTHTRRDTWMHSPEGIQRVQKEAMKIVDFIHNGVIPDFEI
jgi:uncharacterized SAM-binding protein YcdF (DUF218 family)